MNRPYTTWRNTGVSESGATIVNHDQRTRCRHCQNTSIVILDQTNTAAPCPMCVLGGHRAVEWATGKLAPRTAGCAADQPIPESYTGAAVEHYWAGADFERITWNNGLTIRHDRCCNHHGCYRLVTRTGPCSTHDEHQAHAETFHVPPRPRPQTLAHIEPERFQRAEHDPQHAAI